MRPKYNGYTIGEYYDPASDSSPVKAHSRMLYFNVVCTMRPKVAKDLVACYEKNAVIMPYLAMFNTWDFLHTQAEFAAFTVVEDQQQPTNAQLCGLISDLEFWSKDHRLEDIEEWIFDLALSTFEQWLWHPRIPHNGGKVANAKSLPYGFWWGMGFPMWRAYPHINFSFNLTNYTAWEKQQKTKHGELSGPGRGWDDRPTEKLTYNNLMETRRHARARILNAFERELDAHLDSVDEEAERRGYKNAKHTERRNTHNKPIAPFYWLYHRHFDGWTLQQISNYYGEDQGKTLSIPSVSEQTRKLADLIGVAV